jgi:mono/diheme cytochrome c family protein
MTVCTRWIAAASGVGLPVVVAVGTLAWLGTRAEPAAPDPKAAALVARGEAVYAQYCAACHGAHLEGQPNWRERQPNGRLPAPPHDASGHT